MEPNIDSWNLIQIPGTLYRFQEPDADFRNLIQIPGTRYRVQKSNFMKRTPEKGTRCKFLKNSLQNLQILPIMRNCHENN